MKILEEIYKYVRQNIIKKLDYYKTDLYNKINFWNIDDQNLVAKITDDIETNFSIDDKKLNKIWESKSIGNILLNGLNKNEIEKTIDELTKKNIITKNNKENYISQLMNGQLNDVLANLIDNISIYLTSEISLKYFNCFDILREKYIKDLIKKMEIIKKLSKQIKSFFDIFGCFWDLSIHDLYKVDISMLERMSDILNKNNFIEKIAFLLGRIANSFNKYELSLVKDKKFFFNNKKTYYSPENIVSLEQGNDIQNILRHQLSLRNKKNTKLLFNLLYIEKKLIQLEQKNKILEELDENKMNLELKKENQGPFIMCIDTSGSMNGEPENIAKAFALAIIKIAIANKRKCYIISFSTNINEFDASDINSNFDNLYNFLSMSFHGGTDIIQPLKRSIEKVNEKNYKNADIIIISDFIINSIDEELSKEIDIVKQNNVRLHALSIGNSQIKDNIKYFTNNWVYDGTEESVFKIISDLNKIDNK